MRASAAMQDRVLGHDKVQVHFNTSVRDAYGDKKGLKGLVLYDTDLGAHCCRSTMQRMTSWQETPCRPHGANHFSCMQAPLWARFIICDSYCIVE